MITPLIEDNFLNYIMYDFYDFAHCRTCTAFEIIVEINCREMLLHIGKSNIITSYN